MRGPCLKVNDLRTTCEQWMTLLKTHSLSLSLFLTLFFHGNNGHTNKQTKGQTMHSQKDTSFFSSLWSIQCSWKILRFSCRLLLFACVCASVCFNLYDRVVITNDCHNSGFGGKTFIPIVWIHLFCQQLACVMSSEHQPTQTNTQIQKRESEIWVQKCSKIVHSQFYGYVPHIRSIKMAKIYIYLNIKYRTFIIDLLYF